ncbi:hypothetical protein L6452_32462 [Arctium lappa]|uniref:Uncharacterized protein n=1 Tax=Arctium lappa TaxID=4217 RepID=A0ACB8Z5A0_ARCLA|nr:hypothetical protein L6452_32462 [Arctium lappa]
MLKRVIFIWSSSFCLPKTLPLEMLTTPLAAAGCGRCYVQLKKQSSQPLRAHFVLPRRALVFMPSKSQNCLLTVYGAE